jgi:hypothetical protein
MGLEGGRAAERERERERELTRDKLLDMVMWVCERSVYVW